MLKSHTNNWELAVTPVNKWELSLYLCSLGIRALSTSAGESVLVSGPGLPSSWAVLLEDEVSLFPIAPLAPQGYAEEQEVVLGPT